MSIVTREAAEARARKVLDADVLPYPHPGLEGDHHAGGYAFVADSAIAIIGYHGGYLTSVIGVANRTPETAIDDWLYEERLSRPDTGESAFGPSQRLALEAVRTGVAVAVVAGDSPPAVVDHAEYVAISLRQAVDRGDDPAEELTARPNLLEQPESGRRYTHPCPICSTPTIHMDRYPRWVCHACSSRATDSAGRLVEPYSEGPFGGLIVFYAESPGGPQTEIADEVMESGRVRIDGRECSIVDGRFGGVVIQTL